MNRDTNQGMNKDTNQGMNRGMHMLMIVTSSCNTVAYYCWFRKPRHLVRFNEKIGGFITIGCVDRVEWYELSSDEAFEVKEYFKNYYYSDPSELPKNIVEKCGISDIMLISAFGTLMSNDIESTFKMYEDEFEN